MNVNHRRVKSRGPTRLLFRRRARFLLALLRHSFVDRVLNLAGTGDEVQLARIKKNRSHQRGHATFRIDSKETAIWCDGDGDQYGGAGLVR